MKKLHIRPVEASNNGKKERWWAVQEKDEHGNFVTLINGIFSHAYPRREMAAEAREILLQKQESKHPRSVYTHRYYDEQDYEELSRKGYTDEEIAAIWDRDIKHDIVSNLLWLEVTDPAAAKNVLAEYERLKANNPYKSNP
jgi:hypothetical protein